MKKTSLYILLVLLCCYAVTVNAQNSNNNFGLTKVSISPNTVNGATLSVDLQIDISKAKISAEYWIPVANRPKFHLTYNGKEPKCPLKTNFAVTDSSVQVIIGNLSQETVDRIADKDNKISIQFDSDLVFKYIDSSVTPAVSKMGKVTMDVINNMISQNLSFPADQKTKFLTALNNLYYYKNSIDFGVQPGKDSSSVSYTLNFNFENIYSANSVLKCTTEGSRAAKGATTLVYYGISGRLSTNSKDSLNFLNIYPLIVHSSDFKGKIPYEWNLKLGHESNETFTNRRVAADASISLIIPNLVNLTSPSFARLRLKPVIDLGLKGYYDYSKGGNNFASGQAYFNAYYYIPVYDNYTIILNDKTFYDFSKQKNPGRKLAGNYSIAIGTELPKTGFKVMLKYENGKTDINYKQTQAVVIGLLMNLFNNAGKQQQ
jgi:hypothetical protein